MSTTPPLALVTGAARGIGAEVARQLGHAGYEVIVTARDLDAADAHAGALRDDGVIAVAMQLDIGDAHSVTHLAEGLVERALGVLVNNAAAFADWSETPSTADLTQARSVMETNLFGTWQVIQALLPALRRSPSACIVNVGSGSGSHGDPTYGLTTNPAAASYAVSKGRRARAHLQAGRRTRRRRHPGRRRRPRTDCHRPRHGGHGSSADRRGGGQHRPHCAPGERRVHRHAHTRRRTSAMVTDHCRRPVWTPLDG